MAAHDLIYGMGESDAFSAFKKDKTAYLSKSDPFEYIPEERPRKTKITRIKGSSQLSDSQKDNLEEQNGLIFRGTDNDDAVSPLIFEEEFNGGNYVSPRAKLSKTPFLENNEFDIYQGAEDEFDIYGNDDYKDGYSEYLGGSKFHNEDANVIPIKASKVFAVIKGGLKPDSRKRIEELMQSPDNRHGELLSLVLVSSVGAEGLDFKCIRHIHIEEPYWNYARLSQIQFRGIRNDSHKALPDNEKNVQTYIYCAVGPEHMCEGSEGTKKIVHCLPERMELPDFESKYELLPDTTDVYLLREAVANYRVIESFLGPIQRASITAGIDAIPGARLCAPTNEKLYSGDITSDLKMPDKCKPYTKVEVAVKKIEIGGHDFFYREDPDSSYGYSIYKHSANLGGYVAVQPSEPEFMIILDMIE
jgi:hypothetical protein